MPDICIHDNIYVYYTVDKTVFTDVYMADIYLCGTDIHIVYITDIHEYQWLHVRYLYIDDVNVYTAEVDMYSADIHSYKVDIHVLFHQYQCIYDRMYIPSISMYIVYNEDVTVYCIYW